MTNNVAGTPDLLRKILRDASIESAAIIDDAFDPIRGKELGTGITDFWDHCIRSGDDGQLMKELRSFCEIYSTAIGKDFTIAGSEDFTDEVLVSIRDSLHRFPALRETASQTLFLLMQDKLEPILDLETRLGELNVEVRRFGTEFRLGEFRPKIIFLDYFLGVTDESRNGCLDLSHGRREDGYFFHVNVGGFVGWAFLGRRK